MELHTSRCTDLLAAAPQPGTSPTPQDRHAHSELFLGRFTNSEAVLDKFVSGGVFANVDAGNGPSWTFFRKKMLKTSQFPE